MGLRPPLAALLILAAPSARAAEGPASLVAGPPGQELVLEADVFTYDWEARTTALEGHVVVRRGEGVLRAARGKLDRARDTLTLSGGVLAVQGREVFLADAAMLDLASRTADLTNAVVYLKERPASEADPVAGRNALTLHGRRVRRLASGGLEAQDIRLTPCDCKGEPDYEIAAKSAVIEGDRAHLSGAQLRLGGLPVPLFPLSLPLTARQSGLLAPQLGFASVSGFGFAQPVFVTLGRSFDVTLAPGLFTGTGGGGDPAIGQRAVAGPRLGLEGRYAPSEGTRGQLALDLLYDLHAGASPRVEARSPGEAPSSAGRGLSGLRGVARFSHRTDGAAGTLAVQGTAASDAMILADAEPLALDRALDVLRTDAGAWHAQGPLTVGADATLLQDVRVADFARPDRRLFGPERRATFQRLPALFAQLAPVAVGPLSFSSEASVVAMTPLGARDPQEIATGFGPTDRQPGPSRLSGQDFGRAPMLRFDLAPRVALSLPLDVAVDVQAELGARADAWVVQGPGRDRQRAYGYAGVRASVDLERQYGGALHVVTPLVQLRGITRELSGGGAPIGDPADAGGAVYFAYPEAAEQGLGPGQARRDSASVTEGVPASRRAYDEVDFAAPSTGEVEATLGVSQSLWVRRGAVARVVRFDLLQDVLLWSAGARSRFGEASAVASLLLGPVSASLQARYDWTFRALSAAVGNAGVRDARGDELHGSFLLLRGSSSERLRAGIDELFSAVRLATQPGDLSGTASAGASLPLPLARNGLRAGYDVARFIGALPADAPDWSHRLTLVYETPCRCAGVSFTAELPLRDGHVLRSPTIHLALDLKSLGGFTTF